MPRFTEAEIEKAREMDLLTYLMNYEPNELVRLKGNVYCTKEHDSLKISNGKWYWFSRNMGGRSALDYLTKVKGIPFRKAMEIILGQEAYKKPVPAPSPAPQRTQSKLLLPKRNDNDDIVISYLEGRGIDSTLIKTCIAYGFIYEDASHHNCIFVGYDDDKVPRYACYRATNGTALKVEASGSDKRYSFRIRHDSNTLHVFESAIDLLSFMTKVRMDTGKWIKENMVSLGGVYHPKDKIEDVKIPAALERMLDGNKNICKIVFHLDWDDAGRSSTNAFSVLLGSKYLIKDDPPKYGKDMNDELMFLLGRLV